MKKLLLLLTILIIGIGESVAQSSANGIGATEGVYESSMTKAQLWSNLKRWVATSFGSYKHTVDMEDKEAGTMIIKFNSFDERFKIYTSLKLSATLQIDVRDNKWRYKISDAEYALAPNSNLDNISYMSTSSLQRAETELESAQDLSYNVSIPDGLEYNITRYSEKLSGIPQYKKPKDEAKGKENKEYTEVKSTLDMAEYIRTKYSLMTFDLRDSLQKGMAYTNDF